MRNRGLNLTDQVEKVLAFLFAANVYHRATNVPAVNSAVGSYRSILVLQNSPFTHDRTTDALHTFHDMNENVRARFEVSIVAGSGSMPEVCATQSRTNVDPQQQFMRSANGSAPDHLALQPTSWNETYEQ